MHKFSGLHLLELDHIMKLLLLNVVNKIFNLLFDLISYQFFDLLLGQKSFFL